MPRPRFSLSAILWLIVLVAGLSLLAAFLYFIPTIADPKSFLALPVPERRILLGRLHATGVGIAIAAFGTAALAAVYLAVKLTRVMRAQNAAARRPGRRSL